MALLFGVLFSLSTGIAAFASPTPYNITLSDESPTINYFPSRSGPSSSTWNVSYTNSSWSTYVPDSTVGHGISSHFTTFVGASASVSWIGTAVYVFGSAGNGATSFTIDGNLRENIQAPTGLIGMVDGLDYGWHQMLLTVTGDQGVTIQRMTLTSGIGRNGSILTNSTLTSLTTSGTINNGINIGSGWNPSTSIDVANGDYAYSRLETTTPNSSLWFLCPRNTSFVILYGLNNADHGDYSVTLSPPPSTVSNSAPAVQSFSGESAWITLDSVAYFAALDPTVVYNVTYTNGNGSCSFTSATFTSASGGEDDSLPQSSLPASGLPATGLPATVQPASGLPASSLLVSSLPAPTTSPGPPFPSAANQASSTTQSSVPIVAVVVPIAAALLLVFSGIFWLLRRRHHTPKKWVIRISPRSSQAIVVDRARRPFVIDDYPTRTYRDPRSGFTGEGFRESDPNAGHATAPLIPFLQVPSGTVTRQSSDDSLSAHHQHITPYPQTQFRHSSHVLNMDPNNNLSNPSEYTDMLSSAAGNRSLRPERPYFIAPRPPPSSATSFSAGQEEGQGIDPTESIRHHSSAYDPHSIQAGLVDISNTTANTVSPGHHLDSPPRRHDVNMPSAGLVGPDPQSRTTRDGKAARGQIEQGSNSGRGTQETDAGRIDFEHPEAWHATFPPTYDPSWADTSSSS